MRLQKLVQSTLLISAFTLVGCHGVSSTAEADDSTTVGQWIQVGVAPTGYSKAGAPVSLSYKKVSALAPLAAIELPLLFKSLSALDSMLISYNGSDGLQITGAITESIASPAAGQEIPLSVSLVTNQQGTGTLNVFVTTVRTEGGEMFESARAFAVPLGQETIKKFEPPVEIGDDGKTYQTTEL
jgi:hypothetical protein